MASLKRIFLCSKKFYPQVILYSFFHFLIPVLMLKYQNSETRLFQISTDCVVSHHVSLISCL